MRVGHVADLHYGNTAHARPDPETGLPSSVLSTNRCVGAAFDAFLESGVDAVVIAGDVFHRPNPTAAEIVLFGEQLRRLVGHGIPVVLYPGNHDRAPHPGQGSILNVYAGITRVYVTDQADAVGANGLKVGVVPSVSRHALVARTGLDRRAADEAVVDELRRILETFRAANVDVVTGHWPVAGAVIGGEVDLAIIDEPMLSPADLEGPWRYAAMGHIHRSQVITTGGEGAPRYGPRAVGCYAGSIDRASFNEESYRPVALIADLENGGAAESIYLPARPFRTLAFVDDGDELLEISPEDLRAANEGGVIRIVGKVPAERFDLARRVAGEAAEVLRSSGADVVRIQIERLVGERARAAEIAEAPAPRSALETYLEHVGVGEPHRTGVLELAERLEP